MKILITKVKEFFAYIKVVYKKLSLSLHSKSNIMNKQIKDKLPYGTLLKFYELQNNVIDDFFVRGVHYMVKNFNKLHNGDSDCRTLLDPVTNELIFKFYIDMIVLKCTCKDCLAGKENVHAKRNVDDDEFFVVPLFENKFNVSCKTELFMKIRKSYVIR